MIKEAFKAAAYFKKIKGRQHQPVDRLRAYQFTCVKQTLQYAAEQVPYYMETFRKAGIRCEDIHTWDDFREIPILTKPVMRSLPPEAFLPISLNKKKAWKTQTTGSSGIPITVYRNQESAAWDRALIHYCFYNLGIKIHHRFVQLSAILSDKPQPPGPLARLGFKRNFIVNLRQPDEEIIRQIQEIKPDVLFSFPSILLRLAEHVKLRGIHMNLRCLIAQGEVLPEPWRAVIQEAFKAPLYHTYGATEVARIGFECLAQRGYHLIPDAAVVETIQDGRPANFHEEGDLILTNLNNFCSPLVRYQIGDRGILSPRACSCGISYSILENVTGRQDDFILLPSGKKVSARAITHMQFEGIIQYKIIQKTPAHMQVLIIPSPAYGEKTLAEIRKVLNGAFLDESLKIEIIPTESLPVSRTGKLQLVSREF